MDELEEANGSLWSHVGELRATILRILAVVGVAILLCFINYDSLLSFLQTPLHSNRSSDDLQKERLEHHRVVNPSSASKVLTLSRSTVPLWNSSKNIELTAPDTYLIHPSGELVYSIEVSSFPHLVLLGPLEGILIAMKVSFWVGVVGSSPLWLWMLMQFVMPGLQFKERRLVVSFLVTSVVFIVTGGLFAFFITIPIANQYLSGFNQSVGVNLWSLENYLNYTLFLILANGAAFELGAIGIFAVRLGFLTSETLIAKRRLAILGAFIVATLLTPPDVLTQLFLAFPLIGIYEALILYARLRGTLGEKIQ